MFTVVIAVEAEMAEPARLAEAVTSLPQSEQSVEATILNVFKKVDVTGEGGSFDSDDVYDEESFPETAIEVKDALEEEGVSVTLSRRHGDPAAEIRAEATARDADVLVMGGKKRTPVGKAVFGSVAQSLLLDADRPVMSVFTG